MADNDNIEILSDEEEITEEQRKEIEIYHLEEVTYDSDDEGVVEYLDLDLEVTDTMPEAAVIIPEYRYIPEVPVAKPVRLLQTSVLRTNNLVTAAPTKSNQKQTAITGKSKIVDSRIIDNSKITEAKKRKIDDLDTDKVHAVVDAINAKLADSTQSAINGRRNDSNETQITSGSNDCGISSNNYNGGKKYDSLDLFFQSMAQTVISLPLNVQAKIKMDICQVITMAEMKYCNRESIADTNL